MIISALSRSLDRNGMIFLAILAAITIAVPFFNIVIPDGSALHIPTYVVALFGKYICYALLALSIDLVWGYCGILSLGHGAFFALGGYAMGMYLMRQIGDRQAAREEASAEDCQAGCGDRRPTSCRGGGRRDAP